ncbi:MAG TPA: MFS transporter [Steroidobacteraceae bacterium]|nr:MFS transporter [Steroidobacteraceae bacterium]
MSTSSHRAGGYSAAYRRVVALLLTAAYAFNATDRSIIAFVGQAMKLDLKLTDTQLGLLGGTAFGLFYALGGIPIARLAERFNRVNIITAAMVAWSALCASCGIASAFPQLLCIRAGVGIAESGCTPPAHSLISDYYAPEERTSVLSVYTCGISVGYLLAAVVGGYVAQRWGWRAACASVGLPGIAVAVLIKQVIREPARGHSERVPQEAPSAAPFSLRREARALMEVAGLMIAKPEVRHMVLGVTIGGFAAYGFYYFVPSFFSRAFGLNYAASGVLAGIAGGVAVGLGIVAGGALADALAKHDRRWYALVPAAGAGIAVPLFALAVMARDWRVSVAALSAAGFCFYTSLGPTFGVVQNSVGVRQRATATALLYICLNVFALGCGPLFAGWTMDRLGDLHLREAPMSAQAAGEAVSFKRTCPGGTAPAGSGAELAALCKATLVRSTREGLLVTLIFFAWGGLHYFAASFGLARNAPRP